VRNTGIRQGEFNHQPAQWTLVDEGTPGTR